VFFPGIWNSANFINVMNKIMKAWKIEPVAFLLYFNQGAVDFFRSTVGASMFWPVNDKPAFKRL
jgi:hypothetical protein